MSLRPKDRYNVSGLVEAQFQPGTRGRVLRNLFGITRKRVEGCPCGFSVRVAASRFQRDKGGGSSKPTSKRFDRFGPGLLADANGLQRDCRENLVWNPGRRRFLLEDVFLLWGNLRRTPSMAAGLPTVFTKAVSFSRRCSWKGRSHVG